MQAGFGTGKFMLASLPILMLSFILLCSFFPAVQANEVTDYELFRSIEALNVDGVRKALKTGANPNARNPQQGHFKALKTLMYRLVIEKNEVSRQRVFDITKLLLKHGAKIEAYENDILFFPISEGHGPLVRLLLDNGASPFRKYEGRFPMEWAVHYKQEGVVKLLGSYGVSRISSGAEAQIRLIKAAGDHNLTEILKALESGANVNEKDSTGRLALIEAVRSPVLRYEQLRVVEYLLSRGADPNLTGEGGFRGLEGIPLHLVVFMNAPLMNKPHEGRDIIATEVMRNLLHHGARVSAMDSRGRTPLHVAAESDNIFAAQLLLESGARVMPRDTLGKTPLDYAESSAMISLLKNYGAKEQQ